LLEQQSESVRFLFPVEGFQMQRINTAYFYRIAQKLVPLHALIGGSKLYVDNYLTLSGAEAELRGFLVNDVVPPLTSFNNGQELLTEIQRITGEEFKQDRDIEWFEIQRITEALNRFEISLQSDFNVRDTFIVSPKGAYSTTILAERGQTSVSPGVHTLVPVLERDLHDGCRCLAFELGTAAAFHFFRAVEAAVCAYGEFVRSKAFTKSERAKGLGGYANCLKQASLGVDARIINSIEQIASLHRNPTMHPEMHISTAEALATFGMTVSVIETIAIDWNRRKTTPDIPLLDILPDDSKVTALLEETNEEKP